MLAALGRKVFVDADAYIVKPPAPRGMSHIKPSSIF